MQIMTRERYEEMCDEIRKAGAKCKCHDALLFYCEHWNMLRIIANPLQEESDYLDKHSK